MSKPTRESIFRDASRRMRAEFEDARSNVPHRGEAGGEGEAILRAFLNEHLPGRFRATTGFVIDKRDRISGHTDVIIYDSLNCPIYRTAERGMIIPNDNVASVCEVKFSLTTTTLHSAIEKVHELKNLEKTPLNKDHKQPEQIGTYGLIFAFESQISRETLMDRWVEELTVQNPLHNSCSMIVVLDSGVAVTCFSIAGGDAAPASIQGISPAPIGSAVGITWLAYSDRTLDAMIRLLLSHLTFFRHRVDHPGFDFETLGASPVKWIGRYIASHHIEYFSH